MGLFSFLKKKEPEPAPAITATIHAQTCLLYTSDAADD